MESFFFKYAYDFKYFLEKKLEELPVEKRIYKFNVECKIAVEYCINNKDKIIAEIISSKELLAENLKIQNNNLLT